MTPKLKAEELVEKFECYVDYQGDDCFNEREKMLINAKRCALITVDEILKSNPCFEDSDRGGNLMYSNNSYYWQEVKEEINKL